MIKDNNHGKLDFTRLWELLAKKKLNKDFLRNNGVHPATISKLVKGENVSTTVLCEICYLLKCDIKDICTYKKPET